jgi:hypothetical protein
MSMSDARPTQATTTATRKGSLRYLGARATTNDENTQPNWVC